MSGGDGQGVSRKVPVPMSYVLKNDDVSVAANEALPLTLASVSKVQTSANYYAVGTRITRKKLVEPSC